MMSISGLISDFCNLKT